MKGTAEFLRNMLDAIYAIEGYAATTYEEFIEDEKTQDAIMFNLVIMGEAANRVPADFRAQYPDIPWSSIIGTRNIIVHGYDQVKLRIVWDIIQKDLNSLRAGLQKLL